MINFYQSIAQKLYRIRYLFWFLIFCCAGVSVYWVGASTSEAEDVNILLSAIGASWFLGLSVVISYFYCVPGMAFEGDGFFLRWKKKAIRCFSWVLALLMSAASIALIYLSYNALKFYLNV